MAKQGPKKKHLREKENGKSSFVDDLKEHGKSRKESLKGWFPLISLLLKFSYMFLTQALLRHVSSVDSICQ